MGLKIGPIKIGGSGGAERGSTPADAASFTARRDGLRPLPKMEETDPDRNTVDYYVSQSALPENLADMLGQQFKTAQGEPDTARIEAVTERISSGWAAKHNGR